MGRLSTSAALMLAFAAAAIACGSTANTGGGEEAGADAATSVDATNDSFSDSSARLDGTPGPDADTGSDTPDDGPAGDRAADDWRDTGAAGDSADASLDARDAGPTADAQNDAADVFVSNDGSISGVLAQYPDVRQGEMGFSVTVSGTGLSNPTGFDFQGIVVAQVEPGATDGSFTILCNVPHGEPLGLKSLTFTSSGGQLSSAGVTVVTAITSSVSGSDANRGSTSAPFRTYKQAIGVSATGDTIQLTDGTYDAAGGEDWMETLPDGVTLQGQSTNTILSGPGATTTSPNAITASGAATLSSLTLMGFNEAIVLRGPARVQIVDVVATTNCTGLDVAADAIVSVKNQSATSAFSNAGGCGGLNGTGILFSAGTSPSVTLDGTQIDSNYGYGIQVAASSPTVTMTNGEMNANVQSGIFDPQLPGSTPFNLSITGTAIHGNGSFDFQGSYYVLTVNGSDIRGNIGGPAYAGSSVTVTGCTVSFGGGQGFNDFIEFSAGSVTLVNTTIQDGLQTPVWQSGGTATVRGTSITIGAAGWYGWYLSGGTLDLGTSSVPGNNAFTALVGGLTTEYGLADVRPSGSPPTTSSATSFNGMIPQAGVVNGPVTVTGEYEITRSGNAIDFY